MKNLYILFAFTAFMFYTLLTTAQVIEGERLNSEGMHAALTVKTTLNKKDTEDVWKSFVRSQRIGRARSPRGSEEMRVTNASNTQIEGGNVILLAKVNQVANASELSLWVKLDDRWLSKETNEKAYARAKQLINKFLIELQRAELSKDIEAERRVLSDLERERSRFINRTVSRTERDIRNMERDLERKKKELAKQKEQVADKDIKITDQKQKIDNLQKTRKQ